MNLLAHALLSPPDQQVLVGNIVADWVKGRARLALPRGLRVGMALHQKIDGFTDSHPLVHGCVAILTPRWQRYAPVLVDILFDHVLCEQWPQWCQRPRDRVIAGAYHALRAHVHLLGERARYAVHMLLADDWLSTYATLDGIALTLSRVSARLHAAGHKVELAPAVADFLRHQTLFHAAFEDFFPRLQAHARQVCLESMCA